MGLASPWVRPLSLAHKTANRKTRVNATMMWETRIRVTMLSSRKWSKRSRTISKKSTSWSHPQVPSSRRSPSSQRTRRALKNVRKCGGRAAGKTSPKLAVTAPKTVDPWSRDKPRNVGSLCWTTATSAYPRTKNWLSSAWLHHKVRSRRTRTEPKLTDEPQIWLKSVTKQPSPMRSLQGSSTQAKESHKTNRNKLWRAARVTYNCRNSQTVIRDSLTT